MLNYRSRLPKTQGMSTKVRIVFFVFGAFVCFIENAKIWANGKCDKPPTTDSVGGCRWLVVCRTFNFHRSGKRCGSWSPGDQPTKVRQTTNRQQCWWVLVVGGLSHFWLFSFATLTHMFRSSNVSRVFFKTNAFFCRSHP